MGIGSLRDLELAGIKWELAETSKITTANSDNEKLHNAQTDNQIMSRNNVVPPRAPLSLATAEKCASEICNANELHNAISNFDHPLRQFSKNVILPHLPGDKCGGLLIITDTPSADDDKNGQILTGAAGDLMDKMLAAIGLDRTGVSILPMVFWRTPGGRAPSDEEISLAGPFVTRAIDFTRPAVILTLGTLAAMTIAGAKLPGDHGETFDKNAIPVIPVYHPNYLILKPDAKRAVWEALQKVRNFLKI